MMQISVTDASFQNLLAIFQLYLYVILAQARNCHSRYPQKLCNICRLDGTKTNDIELGMEKRASLSLVQEHIQRALISDRVCKRFRELVKTGPWGLNPKHHVATIQRNFQKVKIQLLRIEHKTPNIQQYRFLTTILRNF